MTDSNTNTKPFRVCDIDGCEKKHHSQGYCNKHYLRWKKYGNPLETKFRTGCTVDGCDNPHYARGLCSKHWQQQKGGNCSICGDSPVKARGWCTKHWKRWYRHDDPNYQRETNRDRSCSICGKSPTVGLGYCSTHYQRLTKNGDPELLKTTPRGDGLKFLLACVENPPPDKCVIFPYGGPNGYATVTYRGVRWVAHRLALFLYTGVNPKDKHACHGPCHNTMCINPHPDHGLSWGTPKKNIGEDRLRDGTDNRGEKHGLSKLTESDVRAIREDPRKQVDIANDYGIGDGTVSMIKSRKSWGWLK